MSGPTSPVRSENTYVLAAVFLGFVLLILSAVICVLIAAPESTNTAFVIQVLLGQFGITIPVFVTAIVVGRSNQKMTDILNGEGDRKLQKNLHEFIASTAFSDKIKEQLHAAADEREGRTK